MSDMLDRNLEKLMKRADDGGDPKSGADNKVFSDVMKRLKSDRQVPAPEPRPRIAVFAGIAGALAAAATILIVALSGSQPGDPNSKPGIGSPDGFVQERGGDTVVAVAPKALKLETGEETAEHELSDGSKLTLSPNTRVIVTSLKGRPRPRIELERGEVTCAVAKGRGTFRVVTPAGEAAALGTTYKVSLEEKPREDGKRITRRPDLVMKVTVLSGEVFVNSNAGEGQIARAGQEVSILSEAGPVEDWTVAQLVPKLEDGSQGEPMEVRSHDVKVTIRDQVALVEVDQVFFNPTDVRMEGTFFFPLPAGATICRLAMYVGDNLMEGEIAEAVRARRTFEALKIQRIDPALLEWAGGNNFKMRVFPIEPESEKRVLISYYQVLERENGTVRFKYPLATDALQTHPVGKINVTANVYSTDEISETRAPDLAATVAPGGKHSKVTHTSTDATPQKDFTIEYDLSGEGSELVAMPYWHEKGDDGYFLLALSPELEELDSSKDPTDRFLFVMEKSGPLGQKHLNLAIKAVCHGLKMLDAKDQFAVVAYDTFAEQFGSGFKPGNDQAVLAACEWIGSREAEGASDLTVAWDAVARLAGDEKTVVIYVGSGTSALTSTRAGPLLKEADGALSGKDVSIHCLGVGAVRNDDFLGELARRYSGSFREIAGAADVFTRIPDLIADVGRPLYRNVAVDFEGVEIVDMYPEKLSNIAAGRQLFIYGRHLEQGTATLHVTAAHTNGTYDKSFEIDFGDDASNTCIAPMWASRKIEALQMKAGSSSAGRADSLRREVIETSKRYTVMSQYTSFIVLETPEDYARFGIERRVREFGPYAGQGPAADQLMSLVKSMSRSRGVPGRMAKGGELEEAKSESKENAASEGGPDARFSELRADSFYSTPDAPVATSGRVRSSNAILPGLEEGGVQLEAAMDSLATETISNGGFGGARTGTARKMAARYGGGSSLANAKSDKISWSRENIFPEIPKAPGDPYANLSRRYRRSPAAAIKVLRKLTSPIRTLSCSVTRYSLDSEGVEKKQGRVWNLALDIPQGRYLSRRVGDDSMDFCDGKRVTRGFPQLKYSTSRAAIKRDVLAFAHTLPGMLMAWPEKLDREYNISVADKGDAGLVIKLVSRRNKRARIVIYAASASGPITRIERYASKYKRQSNGRWGYTSELSSTTHCETPVAVGDSKIATVFRIVSGGKTEVVRLSKLLINKEIPPDAFRVEIPEDWSVRNQDLAPGSEDRAPISRPVNPSPNFNPGIRRFR